MKKQTHGSAKTREAITGLLFVSPWIIGLCAFFAFPIFRSLQLCFVNVVNMTDYSVEWAGLDHFKEIFETDTWYIKHFLTSMKEMLLQIPLTNIFAIFIAILINKKFPGRTVYRTIFFLPVICNVPAFRAGSSGRGYGDGRKRASSHSDTHLLRA